MKKVQSSILTTNRLPKCLSISLIRNIHQQGAVDPEKFIPHFFLQTFERQIIQVGFAVFGVNGYIFLFCRKIDHLFNPDE